MVAWQKRRPNWRDDVHTRPGERREVTIGCQLVDAYMDGWMKAQLNGEGRERACIDVMEYLGIDPSTSRMLSERSTI